MQDSNFSGRNPINVNNLHIPSDEEVLRFYITIPVLFKNGLALSLRSRVLSVASVRLMSPT